VHVLDETKIFIDFILTLQTLRLCIVIESSRFVCKWFFLLLGIEQFVDLLKFKSVVSILWPFILSNCEVIEAFAVTKKKGCFTVTLQKWVFSWFPVIFTIFSAFGFPVVALFHIIFIWKYFDRSHLWFFFIKIIIIFLFV